MQQKYYFIHGIIAIIGIILISGCIKEDADNSKEWVEISIFCQCCKEPWGDDANIKSFFEDKEVKVYDINIESRGMVCEACNCPSYEIKEILVDIINKEKALEILNKTK